MLYAAADLDHAVVIQPFVLFLQIFVFFIEKFVDYINPVQRVLTILFSEMSEFFLKLLNLLS